MKFKDYNLSDRFQIKGYWWLPESPDQMVPGVLTHDDGIIELELFGSLHEQPQPFVEAGQVETVFTIPLILGRGEGEHVTLVGSIETGTHWTNIGDVYSQLKSSLLIIGYHALTEADLRFRSVRFRFAGLEEWLNQYPIEVRHTMEDDKNVFHQTFRFPTALVADLPGLDARLESDYQLNTSQPSFGSREWTYSAYFKIIPHKEEPLEWFLKVAFRCRDFLTFCFGQAVAFRQYLLDLGDVEYEVGFTHPEEAALFLRRKARRLGAPPAASDMILSYPSIQTVAPTVIANWFQKVDQLETVIELLMGTYYDPDLHTRFRFLSLIQAIESFARLTMPGAYLDDETYVTIRTALVKAIPAGTPNDLRNSLKNKLKYGNEHSLRKRIVALIGTLKPTTSVLITDDPAKFAGVIVETRNYFTHYTDELKESAIRDGKELIEATDRLERMMIILLLKGIGLAESTIIEIIRRNPRFKQRYESLARIANGSSQKRDGMPTDLLVPDADPGLLAQGVTNEPTQQTRLSDATGTAASTVDSPPEALSGLSDGSEDLPPEEVAKQGEVTAPAQESERLPAAKSRNTIIPESPNRPDQAYTAKQ